MNGAVLNNKISRIFCLQQQNIKIKYYNNNSVVPLSKKKQPEVQEKKS